MQSIIRRKRQKIEPRAKQKQSKNKHGRGCGAHAGDEETDGMRKTGRTRARSRGIQREGQRQPDFTDSTEADAPGTHGTHATTTGDGTPMEGTPEGTPPDLEVGLDAQGETEDVGARAQGGEGAGSSEARMETEGNGEEGSLSEESEDSQGATGEEKEHRLYWKGVGSKVEAEANEVLDNAKAARHRIYEKQVRDLGEIVDPTSSEGEEEGDVAEQRRERRREREVEMRKRRIQKKKLHEEYLESRRHIRVEEQVVKDMRRRYEEQLEHTKQARAIGKRLRAKRRVAVRKEEQKARKAREERRNQAARQRGQQEEEGRGDEGRKRKSERDSGGGQGEKQGEQTPAGKRRDRMQTRSSSLSSKETPDDSTDVSIVLASERGLPAEGEIFAHFTRMLGMTPSTGAEWDIEITPEGVDQPLFIKGYKLTLPVECLREECMEGPLATNELHTERWGVWQIALWRGAEDEGSLGCVARMRGGGGPQAWNGTIILPAVTGGEVLRKAGEERMDQGTEEEREDLKGVTVNTVQQLYVNVRGMRTSAATNKCEFSYTTPSGQELKWGPTRFTLCAEYHKRSLKAKSHTANTYHTVRGALVLNEPSRWCELCACAHGKDCRKLRAYRTEEVRRTNELLSRAKRETAPSRAQQQATRPEYTLNVEREKQVRDAGARDMGKKKRKGATNKGTDRRTHTAGSGGSGDQGVRGNGERRRRSTRSFAGGAECTTNADDMQGL
eukprot:4907497-Pleurochrysis_carterae.AAC.1